ncbi:MAG: hypothetical protein ACYDEQ_10505, partial [Desulfocucumaceae bacterium]
GLIKAALEGNNQELAGKALDAIARHRITELWTEVAAYLNKMAIWKLKAKALNVLETLAVLDSYTYIEPFLQDENHWVQEAAESCLAALAEKENAEDKTTIVG